MTQEASRPKQSRPLRLRPAKKKRKEPTEGSFAESGRERTRTSDPYGVSIVL
jgi:hypothetical protein